MVVSLWTEFSEGNSSIIKLGSWDEHGVEDGKELSIIRTPTKYSWLFKIKSSTYSGKDIIPEGQSRLVNFDPQLPYIYIPQPDFRNFMSIVSSMFPDQVICKDTHCYFVNRCAHVTEQWQDFTIQIYDSINTSPEFKIPEQDMLVSGETFADEVDTCYIGIFPNGNSKILQSWYVGNLFMKSYYMVYDLSTFDEHGEDYLQIGIGPKNPNNMLGKMQYDTSYNYYWPADESLDQS